MRRNFLMMAFLCLFTVVAMSSCDKDKEKEKEKETTPVAVTGVALNKTELTLNVGLSETLTATVTPDDADDKTVTWTTSDSEKVTVSADGLVTAVAKGSATVTATAGDKSAGCVVTVTADTIINVAVENGSNLNGKVDLVKVIGEYVNSNGEWDVYVATSAPFSNGGFTLKLPESISDSYMSGTEDISDGMTVSNSKVKVGIAYIAAYEADDKTGLFYHGTADCMSILMFANGDLSVTGSETYEEDDKTYIEKYNMHLKKGWNIVYVKETETANDTYENEMSSTVPSGAKWYFYDYYLDDWDSVESFKLTKVPFLLKSQKVN